MGALRDCEAVVDAFLGQPVNTLTALAFVAGGTVVALRSTLTWVGIAAIGTGLGSFLFHGPMPPLAEWAHDATLAWLLLVVAGYGRPWERWTRLPGLAALALLAAIPGWGDPLGVLLGAAAVANVLLVDRGWSTLGPVILLVVAGVIGRLGATGGPLCDPASPWQPHGLWHVAAAAALSWWALTTSTRG